MGSALAQGVLQGGWPATNICVIEQYAQRRERLAEELPGVLAVESPAQLANQPEVIILAIKPQDSNQAIEELAEHLPTECLIISIVAGLTLAELAKALPQNPSIRTMPNTPALLGAGISAISPDKNVSGEHLESCQTILGSVGEVVQVTEDQLDAVTAVSGSGPAYVFLLAEAMISAGVAEGLSEELSRDLVNQTILGSGRLLTETSQTADQLRKAVTSPGGTTEAAIKVLEDNSFSAILTQAVKAAAKKSQELDFG